MDTNIKVKAYHVNMLKQYMERKYDEKTPENGLKDQQIPSRNTFSAFARVGEKLFMNNDELMVLTNHQRKETILNVKLGIE